MALITFQNGAALDVKLASFVEAEEMLSAFLEAIQGVPVAFDTEDALKVSVKAFISRAFTSPRMKGALWACAGRSNYRKAGTPNELPAQKMQPALFESAADRDNLIEALYVVAEANLLPFSKGLYAVSESLSKAIESSRTSTS